MSSRHLTKARKKFFSCSFSGFTACSIRAHMSICCVGDSDRNSARNCISRACSSADKATAIASPALGHMFAVSQTGTARYMVVATRSERIIENGGPRSRAPRPAALLRRQPGEGVVTARPQKLGFTDIAERLAPSLLQQRLTESQRLRALLLGQLLVLAKKLAYGVAKLGRKVAQELREFRP